MTAGVPAPGDGLVERLPGRDRAAIARALSTVDAQPPAASALLEAIGERARARAPDPEWEGTRRLRRMLERKCVHETGWWLAPMADRVIQQTCERIVRSETTLGGAVAALLARTAEVRA